MAEPSLPEETKPLFVGHEGRECGEHRTVGSHRAWCYDCQEWCYPAAPCNRCELPKLRDARKAVAETLIAAGRMVTSDSRDWSLSRSDAWLYGLLLGWECDEQHEHDWICGGDGALREVAARHGWGEGDIVRIRRFRAAVQFLGDV